MKKKYLSIFCFLTIFINACVNSNSQTETNKSESLENKNLKSKIVYNNNLKKVGDIPCPENFMRLELDSNSFAYFLRNISIRQNDNTVYLYNGEKKQNQNVQFAVLDIEVGTKDLQQCADAVMRLRGEYLYGQKKYSNIHFNFLSDAKPRYFLEYSKNDTSYKSFRKYMDNIFAYANTASLNDELQTVDINDMKIGDVFIQKKTPYGHAIIVVDMAVNSKTNQKIFLIAQSYMPAQDIHILLNLNNLNISPWYELDFGETLYTPEWTFKSSCLKRFLDK